MTNELIVNVDNRCIFVTDGEMTMYDNSSSVSQWNTKKKQDDHILIAYFLFACFNNILKHKKHIKLQLCRLLYDDSFPHFKGKLSVKFYCVNISGHMCLWNN